MNNMNIKKPSEYSKELVKKYIPTSRALQIEVSSGRAITNTNYWMRNAIKNAIHETMGIISTLKLHIPNSEDFEFAHQYYLAIIENLNNRLDEHPVEKHSDLKTPDYN